MVLFVGCVVKMKAVLVVKKVGVQKRIFVKIISAVTKSGYDSCCQCPDFPCQDSILHKLRIRTFCKFIGQYGEEKLIVCLRKNESNGVIYHYPNSHLGDYDLESEEAIYHLILKGK